MYLASFLRIGFISSLMSRLCEFNTCDLKYVDIDNYSLEFPDRMKYHRSVRTVVYYMYLACVEQVITDLFCALDIIL